MPTADTAYDSGLVKVLFYTKALFQRSIIRNSLITSILANSSSLTLVKGILETTVTMGILSES